MLHRGALIVGFGATQPWASFDTTQFGGLGLSHGHDFGFDAVPNGDGTTTATSGFLIGVAVFIGLNALALMATRVRGLGALWRVLSLIATVPAAVIIGVLWHVVQNPSDELAAQLGGGFFGGLAKLGTDLASDFNLIDFGPGPGLWLTTIGAALVVVGAFIPAIRSIQQPFPYPGAGTWGPAPGGPSPAW